MGQNESAGYAGEPLPTYETAVEETDLEIEHNMRMIDHIFEACFAPDDVMSRDTGLQQQSRDSVKPAGQQCARDVSPAVASVPANELPPTYEHVEQETEQEIQTNMAAIDMLLVDMFGSCDTQTAIGEQLHQSLQQSTGRNRHNYDDVNYGDLDQIVQQTIPYRGKRPSMNKRKG